MLVVATAVHEIIYLISPPANLGSTGFLILKAGTESLRIVLSVIIGHKLMCGVVIFWLMGV